ncbi:unnamed protein product, partial [Protopolystoma xenopodis]
MLYSRSKISSKALTAFSPEMFVYMDCTSKLTNSSDPTDPTPPVSNQQPQLDLKPYRSGRVVRGCNFAKQLWMLLSHDADVTLKQSRPISCHIYAMVVDEANFRPLPLSLLAYRVACLSVQLNCPPQSECACINPMGCLHQPLLFSNSSLLHNLIIANVGMTVDDLQLKQGDAKVEFRDWPVEINADGYTVSEENKFDDATHENTNQPSGNSCNCPFIQTVDRLPKEL